jgi:group I intron endonuclease
VNDNSYVGITGVGIDNRFKGHLQSKNSTMVLPLAINKYGPENFIIEKLDEAETAEELYEMEKFYIKEYESHISLGKGYNLTWGGNGTFGDLSPMRNPEIIEKYFKETHHMKRPECRARMMGDLNPAKRPEVREKLSGDNNPAKRPDVRQKISDSWIDRDPQIMKDMGLSIRGENHPANKPETAHIWHEDNAAKRPEVRAAISKAGKGKKKPESVCGDNAPSKRPEVRAKIAKTKTGVPNPSACFGKEITIDGITYISIQAAKRALGWTDGEMYRYTTRGTTDKLPNSSGENHPCKQADVRKKISEGTKGKSKNRGGTNSAAKAVVIDCVIYTTIKEAIQATGISGTEFNKLLQIGRCKFLDKNQFPLRGI